MSTTTLAIVGASLAGAKAAEAARGAGYDGRIVLIGDEPHAPYERPPLSKAILRGEAEPDSARVHPHDFYADQHIDVIEERVVAFDPLARRIVLAGSVIDFDRAVLATGASPRRLGVPGSNLRGVHYLRSIDDSLALRDAIRGAQRVAVIGAGWIGCEVAASARQMGADVVMVDPSGVPLRRVLGDTIGGVFAALHADHGVELRLGARLEGLRGGTAVEEIVLHDGRREPADAVVVGIGVTPRTELADAAPGLRVDNGIVVDQHLETSVAGVYAAGDVASVWHPRFGRYVRVEHWANALNQGTTAGGNAAGRRDTYDRLPYFFSDQYDLGLEYVGAGSPDDEVIVRGDLEGREFIVFWHRDAIVSAALNVNVWDAIDDLKHIVASGTPTDVARLVNLAIPLHDIATAA